MLISGSVIRSGLGGLANLAGFRDNNKCCYVGVCGLLGVIAYGWWRGGL